MYLSLRWKLCVAVSFINTSASFAQLQGSMLRRDPLQWHNPLSAYRAEHVPELELGNSPKLQSLIRDGALNLSLSDSITMALESNLDLVIARYNLPIAQADILRTKAGGTFRGVNTGVIQNTPGGGVGSFSAESGVGAGGTSGGAGGAGTGAAGLVESTLGTGTPVAPYDPLISINGSVEHDALPLANEYGYGVPLLHLNTVRGNITYSQAFPTGTLFALTLDESRRTENSQFTLINPQLQTSYRIGFQQQLLAGFGPGPNLRYLRIARNNQKISDVAFELQVIATVNQIANLYWDLVSAYEEEEVRRKSLDFSKQTLELARKQLDLKAIAPMQIMRDEGEVANNEQDLAIARSQLRLQELLMKNAITRNLDDPILETMLVKPTDRAIVADASAEVTNRPAEEMVADALQRRLELRESDLDLNSRNLSRRAAENALLPTLALNASYGGTGLGGTPTALASTTMATYPASATGTFSNAFNQSAPDYYVGLSLSVPLRNRIAKSDQLRAELEARQAEVRLIQLRKQIRIEVSNAQYALEECSARLHAAGKARDLAARTFDMTAKQQALGAGSELQTLQSSHDLAAAESSMVFAQNAYQKALLELRRTAGRTLDDNNISIEAARRGSATDAVHSFGRPAEDAMPQSISAPRQ
jgi:outer membrane protein TolC